MAGPSRSRPQVDDQLALAYDVANVNCHFSSDIEAEVEGLVAVDRELEDLREREEQQKDINGPWRGVLTRASYNLAWLQELSEIVERGKLEERKACAQRLQHQQDQVLQSQTQQQSLQEQLDKWKDHPTDCTNTILTLEKRRSGDETKIKALQEKLKHWDSHPDCKKTISQLEVRLEEESKKLRPLELHLASCKTETETLKQQLHDRDRKISSFENEVTGYKKEIQELKQKLQDAPTNNSGDPYEGLGGAHSAFVSPAPMSQEAKARDFSLDSVLHEGQGVFETTRQGISNDTEHGVFETRQGVFETTRQGVFETTRQGVLETTGQDVFETTRQNNQAGRLFEYTSRLFKGNAKRNKDEFKALAEQMDDWDEEQLYPHLAEVILSLFMSKNTLGNTLERGAEAHESLAKNVSDLTTSMKKTLKKRHSWESKCMAVLAEAKKREKDLLEKLEVQEKRIQGRDIILGVFKEEFGFAPRQ